MSYRFTLAALTAALTLTGCAKHQKPETPEDFFNGPSQINVSHVMTRADDGSSIFLTVDGNDAGPLLPGKNTEVQIPAGKHQVGGYAQTLLGLGRVTIQSLEVTTNPGEVTQLAYSVTRDKPGFVKEGVTRLPVKPAPAPAPEPVKEEAAPAQDNQSPATVIPATTATDSSTASAAATENSATSQASTPAASSTEPATTTTESTPAAQSTTTTTETTQSTVPSGSADTTETSQSATASQPVTTTTETTQSAASSQPAASTQSTTASQPATTTETTQSTPEEGSSKTPSETTGNVTTEQSVTTPIATAQASGSSE